MKVIVVGGGAAGMMAAITSAKEGNEVTLLEKTHSCGNKIKITGKGRCNITFDGDMETFQKNVVRNNKFMYSSFMNFTNYDVLEYFNSLGVETKLERGGRYFPVSDKAEDIVNALKIDLKRFNVKIEYDICLKELVVNNGILEQIKTSNGEYTADKFIICTGGKSYKVTGSSGEVFDILAKAGHNIIELKPGLVPLRCIDNDCKELQGLSLRNVSFKLLDNGKEVYNSFGEMLFTHFGITGPIVLSGSSIINRIDNIESKFENKSICGVIDLKPALDLEKLDKRIQRDFEKYTNKEFKNSLNDLLPQKLIPVIVKRSRIDPDKKVHQITREERLNLIDCIKKFKLTIVGLLPIDVGIITVLPVLAVNTVFLITLSKVDEISTPPRI